MEGFYFIVIVIAIIMLILLLAYIGTRMTGARAGTDTMFPPVKNTCPDLWTADPDGNCIIPANAAGTLDENKNIGDLNDYNPDTCVDNNTCINGYSPMTGASPANINFNDISWDSMGMNSDCAKSSWANTHGIHWDGISNYNQC